MITIQQQQQKDCLITKRVFRTGVFISSAFGEMHDVNVSIFTFFTLTQNLAGLPLLYFVECLYWSPNEAAL